MSILVDNPDEPDIIRTKRRRMSLAFLRNHALAEWVAAFATIGAVVVPLWQGMLSDQLVRDVASGSMVAHTQLSLNLEIQEMLLLSGTSASRALDWDIIFDQLAVLEESESLSKSLLPFEKPRYYSGEYRALIDALRNHYGLDPLKYAGSTNTNATLQSLGGLGRSRFASRFDYKYLEYTSTYENSSAHSPMLEGEIKALEALLDGVKNSNILSTGIPCLNCPQNKVVSLDIPEASEASISQLATAKELFIDQEMVYLLHLRAMNLAKSPTEKLFFLEKALGLTREAISKANKFKLSSAVKSSLNATEFFICSAIAKARQESGDKSGALLTKKYAIAILIKLIASSPAKRDLLASQIIDESVKDYPKFSDERGLLFILGIASVDSDERLKQTVHDAMTKI